MCAFHSGRLCNRCLRQCRSHARHRTMLGHARHGVELILAASGCVCHSYKARQTHPEATNLLPYLDNAACAPWASSIACYLMKSILC